MGLIQENGKDLRDPAYRLTPGSRITINTARVIRFRHFFEPHIPYYKKQSRIRKGKFGIGLPKNFKTSS